MVERGAARRLTDDEISSWEGHVWYIAHQIALNLMSKSTPCRVVWNCSQPCNGYSLNSILAKGSQFNKICFNDDSIDHVESMRKRGGFNIEVWLTSGTRSKNTER